MFKWIFIVYLWFQLNNTDQCAGYVHRITGSYTGVEDNGFTRTFRIVKRVLFARNSTTPKSYVVGFKFVSDHYSPVITSGTIHSDAPNTYGHGGLNNGIDSHDNHYLTADIHVTNATSFQVDVELHAMSGLGSMGLNRWLRLKEFRPRSFALICAIDEIKPKTKDRHIMFGARKDGDTILHAQKVIISLTGEELPRHKFEFQDDDTIITAALIRLNSTRAIVFHNKVELTEHRFSATIFGRSQDKIAGILIIYGHRT